MFSVFFEAFKVEYKKTPMAFLGALFGIISLILNASFFSALPLANGMGGVGSDLWLVARFCLYFVAQGAVFSVASWLQIAVTAMGPGFPFAIYLSSCVFIAGISQISSYVFCVFGVSSLEVSRTMLISSFIVSSILMIYFARNSFKKRYQNLPIKPIAGSDVQRRGYWELRMFISIILTFIFQFAFFVYFVSKIKM